MTKVKLPQPVADKLDQLRDFGYGTETIFACRADSSPNYAILRTIPFDTFLQAVVNGYERDMTEKDRHADLLSYYLDMVKSFEVDRAAGIRCTLEILGITIAGINDQTEVSTNE